MENKVSNVLKETGFTFKKQFGQNFITDKNLLSDIVNRAEVDKTTTVVEVGCGAGTLTAAIAEKAKRVIAFEIDTKLQPVLERTLAGVENVEVVFKDFLKVDMQIFEEQLNEDYAVVANLPYYITTPLIMQFVERSARCKSLTVMVQEEVAKRLCAEANTPDYGAITAIIALKGRGKIIKNVPRKMFYPIPNVDSAVVKINLTQGGVETEDAEFYKKVVHAAFSSRRKTLENNLVNSFKLTRGQAKSVIEESGIIGNARGETLSPAEFAVLSKNLKKIMQ